MNNLIQPGTVEYRVSLVDAKSTRIAVTHESGILCLPRVSIPARSRLAHQLREAVHETYGIDAFIVDFLPLEGTHPRIVVAELTNPTLPPHFHLADPFTIPSVELAEGELVELELILGRRGCDGISRIGWIHDALVWIEDATGSKLYEQSLVEQFNAGRGFALLRVPGEGGRAFWLKATASPNEHERELTKCLSSLCPDSLPVWIAEKPAWNAWLMKDEAGHGGSQTPADVDIARQLRSAVTSMAKLQLRTIGCENELFTAGANDQRTNVLRADAALLFSYLSEALEEHGPSDPNGISLQDLRNIREAFESACDRLDSAGCPATIIHGDMNRGNLLFSTSGCKFIDWSEGYIGFPFVTLQHILLMNTVQDASYRASLDQEIKDLYCEIMRDGLTSAQLEAGLACMALLGAASAVYRRGDWLLTEARYDPRRHEFSRLLVRHMKNAARELMACSH